jgi:hypothetical protein
MPAAASARTASAFAALDILRRDIFTETNPNFFVFKLKISKTVFFNQIGKLTNFGNIQRRFGAG